MSKIILLTLWLCPQPKIINHTKTWVQLDKDTVEIARERCKTIFDDDTPCLKWFYKMQDREYRAICGGKTPNGH